MWVLTNFVRVKLKCYYSQFSYCFLDIFTIFPALSIGFKFYQDLIGEHGGSDGDGKHGLVSKLHLRENIVDEWNAGWGQPFQEELQFIT